MKEAIAKLFQRSRVGGRRYSRSPNDSTAPTAPVIGNPVAPSDIEVTISWTYGVDAHTGIGAALCEISPAGAGTWTQTVVDYDPDVTTYTFTGLTGNTAYDVRVANRDGAPTPNVSAYSSVKTITTPASVAQLQPGQISITSSAVSVLEGAQISVEVTRTGPGSAAPTVECDYVFENFSSGTPTDPTGTLSWSGTSTGARTAVATAGSVSANTTGQFRITAVRALSGTINPSLGTSTLAVTIQDGAASGNAVSVGVGKTYTTLAAMNAAITAGANGPFELYGTFNESLVTGRAGTQSQPIVVRAAPGQSPVITGYVTNQGQNGTVHLNHAWWDFGEGIEVRGNSTGSYASWVAGTNPERGILVRASNVTVRGKGRNMKQDWLMVPSNITGQSGLRVTGFDGQISGTLDATNGVSPKADAADGVLCYLSAKDGYTRILIESSRFKMGGHACTNIRKQTNVLIRQCLYDGDWSSVFGATYGQKGFDLMGYSDCVEDVIVMNIGKQVDNPSTQCIQHGSRQSRLRRLFLINSSGAQGCSGISCNTLQNPGSSLVYACHLTIYNMTGAGFGVDDSTASVQYHGPVYLKNCIIASCSTNPHASKEGYPIYFQYRSTRGTPWTSKFFVESCALSSNQQIEIRDLDNSVATIRQTISQLQANYPANFRNNIIVNPNFVSTANPVSIDPLTALAQAQANFLPQAASLLGAAAPLTTVASAANNSTTVTLTDAGWFRDAMGWSHLTGDDIYFAGVGTRRITAISGNVVTLNSAITVSAGTGVFLGTDSTPNIGAVL